MAGPAAAVDVADEALQPPTGMATDMVMERSRLVATSYASPTGSVMERSRLVATPYAIPRVLEG
eukprot:scaffold214314_cov19-Tisochrysis_lutea.AAC.1